MPSTSYARWNLQFGPGGIRFAQIFGVVLLLVAAARIKPVVSYIADGVRMRNWEAAPAVVLEFAFVPEPEPNDERPALRVRYRYAYRNADYEGTRADIAQGHWFITTFAREMAAELEKHRRDETPVECFVNPARPEESVLNRRFYYSVFAFRLALFGVLALAGGLFLGVGTLAFRRRRYTEQQQASHPQEPWLWRADWAAGRIRSASGIDTRLLLAFAGIYLFVVLPLGLLMLHERGEDLRSVSGVVMLVLGWGAFNLGWQRLRRNRRLDAGEFQLAGPTGVIGGPLAGVATLPMKLPEGAVVRVSVECLRIDKSSRHEGIEESVLWRDSTQIQKPLGTEGSPTTAVPVSFAIPFESEPSGTKGAISIHWRLKVGPEGGEGLQQYAMFEVPVFRTAESSRDYKPDPALMQKYEVPVVAADVVQHALCSVERLPDGGQLLRFSLLRPFILAAGLGILLACAAGIAAILRYTHFGWTIFPGLFAVALLLGISEMLFWGSRLEIRPESITVSSGLAGFRRRRVLARDEMTGLEAGLEFAMQERSWYCVRLVTTDGQRFLLAKRLPTQREADLLAAWLRDKLGIV